MIDNPIYKAQCFGNIEPIEYMVPYPNLRSLAEGQCIKFSDNILFEDTKITNKEFLNSINIYCNWLVQKNITAGDRIVISDIKSPTFDMLCYAIWSIGAVLVIIDENIDSVDLGYKLIIDSNSLPDSKTLDSYSSKYTTTNNVLLNDEAVEYHHNGKGIIISHYNLLINTYGILKELNILHKETLQINLPYFSTTYIVLHTILPLYAGTSISKTNPNITFGTDGRSDYHIHFDWKYLKDTKPQSLYVLPEATAILAIGKKPNHLLSIKEENNSFKINGHSVMMGYTDDKTNSSVFKLGSLIISK